MTKNERKIQLLELQMKDPGANRAELQKKIDKLRGRSRAKDIVVIENGVRRIIPGKELSGSGKNTDLMIRRNTAELEHFKALQQ